MSGGNKPGNDGKYQILSSLMVLPPNNVCTETYLIIDAFEEKVLAENCCTYLRTMFVRFLLLQALYSLKSATIIQYTIKGRFMSR